MRTTFLPCPSAIRAALTGTLGSARRLDAAVAFVGRDWSDILGTFSGRTRLVCWLSSTATNPYAVAQMIQRGLDVRQLDEMHAKVFLCLGSEEIAIVGSANLSSAALAVDDAAGQFEAAMQTTERRVVRAIREWFGDLWLKARPIRDADLAEATRHWEQRRREPRHAEKERVATAGAPGLPSDWSPTKRLVSLARKAARLSLAEELGGYLPLVKRLEDRGDKSALQQVVEALAEWTGHIGAYYPVYGEPPAKVRRAFRTLFDRGLALDARLEALS